MAEQLYFVKKKRKPKSQRPIQKARKVINNITKVLQKGSFKEEVGIKAAEVFVGGSVGQGTAVTHHYDLDLVLYSHSIKYQEVIDNGYEDLQEKIKSYLARELRPNYTYKGVTNVAIQFRYKLPEKGYLDVDLLLSPYWETTESYLEDLAKIESPLERFNWFSVSVSKDQVAFIKRQPQRVRELICRAKAWRNVVWEDSDHGKPKSYPLSLLVIIAYNRVDNQNATFKVLAEEVGYEMVEVVDEITKSKELDLIVPGTSAEVSTSPLLPRTPRIIDPVNPTNNIYLSAIGRGPYGVMPGERWDVFKKAVATIDITTTAERIMARAGKGAGK